MADQPTTAGAAEPREDDATEPSAPQTEAAPALTPPPLSTSITGQSQAEQPASGQADASSAPAGLSGTLAQPVQAPETATPDVPGTTANQSSQDELEELLLPTSVQALPPLCSGATTGPDGRLRIGTHLGSRGRVNRYLATWHDQVDQPALPVELHEGPADLAALAREAEVLTDVQYAMLPRVVCTFEHEGRRFVAVEPLEAAETLDQALRAGLELEQAISIAIQLTQVLRRLHKAGWVVVGLSPTDVLLGQPLRLTQLGSAVRIGDLPPQALHIAGYSAPELAHREAVTGKEPVYSVGAMLYHALAGEPLPEYGLELTALPELVPIPGVPQLLSLALASADERPDLEAFYRCLLAFKEQLGATSLALEIASGTTVGLNPTRPVNEDSCCYLTWSTAQAGGASFRAVLCVADGMGGMDAGEVASQTAIRAMLSAALDIMHADAANPPPLDPVSLVRQAAPAVHAAGQGQEMGTTVTCVAVDDGRLTLGHVGDTRAYLMREGVLTRLTADHSLVAAMVAHGVLTADEARGHPDSHKVLRSLGSQRVLPDRYVDDLSAAYGAPVLQLRPNDWLLLCSDGVWGSVDDQQLRTVLAEALDCPTVVRAVTDLALRAGAPDNATAIVARCVEIPVR